MKKTEKTDMIMSLNAVLADSYAIYIKTQNYHWNVTGPDFPQLHRLFEKQYKKLQKAIDTLAERIRALGAHASGSFKEFIRLTTINEPLINATAESMIADLRADHTKVIKSLQEAVRLAKKMGDEATLNLLAERLAAHEKTGWMLDSLMRERSERYRKAA